jgi:hypothetical protein
VEEAFTGESQADVTSACFALLAEATPNAELRTAIRGAADRLHAFRRLEASVIDPIFGDLNDVLVQSSGQRQAIRRYHTARMRAVPALVRARSARK